MSQFVSKEVPEDIFNDGFSWYNVKENSPRRLKADQGPEIKLLWHMI